jgi:hypothetical protein
MRQLTRTSPQDTIVDDKSTLALAEALERIDDEFYRLTDLAMPSSK